MISQNNNSVTRGIKDNSRRAIIKQMMLAIPGMVLSPHYVQAFENPDNIGKKITENDVTTLHHFIQTIIPGTETYCPAIVNEMSEEFYGFQKYIKSLTKNLNESARQKFQRSFIGLSEAEKMIVVDEGTKQGLFKKQIYNAAIYIIQVIVFIGLCETDQSCSIINFPGNKRGPFITYEDHDLLNVKSLGLNGNPV